MPNSPKRRRIVKPGIFAKQRKGTATNETTLRALFRQKGILQKVQNGELQVKVARSSHPSPPRAAEPICTLSQLLEYFDLQGNKIAAAHQYLRMDGKIGASGLPDPKEVLHDGVLYFLPNV